MECSYLDLVREEKKGTPEKIKNSNSACSVYDLLLVH
jgi:hypothetical protein